MYIILKYVYIINDVVFFFYYFFIIFLFFLDFILDF